MAGNDFVLVQLTAAGIAFAEGHPLTLSNGRRTFTFKPGDAPARVEKSYEWNVVLSKQHTPAGLPLFELAPAAAVPAATGGPTLVSSASTAETTSSSDSKESN